MQNLESSQKVFFLGASKMGTSSIHKALYLMGLRSVHSPKFGLYSQFPENPRSFFEQGDYFLDGCFHNFIQLQSWYPDAKFVLLERDSEAWLLSLFNWFSYIGDRHMQEESWLNAFSERLMGRRAYTDLLMTLLVHRERALTYFKDSSRFLHIDITSGPAAWHDLSQFLGIKLVPQIENVSSQKVKPPWLEKVVVDAHRKSKHYSHEYPVIQSRLGRHALFRYVIEILAQDFFRERHIMRHLHESLFSPRPNPKKVVLHLFRFLRVVFCLGLRFVIIPQKVQSPFMV